MFTKRIIPCLDVNNGRVVKGVNFVNLRDAGDPVEIAAAYDKAGADELVFLDITASSDNRGTVVDMVRRVAETVFIPFTVGGGIRTVEDFRMLLREGADKISINSSAIDRPRLISDAADSAWWWPLTPGAGKTDPVGTYTNTADGWMWALTQWNGPWRRTAWEPGRSFSPAWTVTAPTGGMTMNSLP